jgi:hypothetical protein
LHKDIYVPLTGGLGNQLFQLAAGLKHGQKVHLIQCLGSPRQNSNIPDICHFKLPEHVDVINCNGNHRLASLFYNFVISVNSRRKYLSERAISRLLIKILSSLIFSIHFRRFIWVAFTSEIGFDEKFTVKHANFIIGYFQSWRYFDDRQTVELLKEIEILETSSEIYKAWKLLAFKNVLGIHVRLGDYKKEKSFGTLDRGYFARAIKLLESNERYDEAWLFSDEPELALAHIPELAMPLRVVPAEGISPAETLDLMRDCSSFVMSNSTFSWWAAFIARVPAPKVIAPNPWFTDLENPRDLLPPQWIDLSRYEE